MVNNSEHLIRIRGKLRQVYPYADDEVIEDMATRMVNCVPELKQNLYEWEEGKAVFIPDGYDYEIIDDGVNEAAIWLDQEIEKRKAAAYEDRQSKD